MEWKLPEIRNTQYQQLVQSAHDLERTLGTLVYKQAKFVKMREEIDDTVKKWWDEVIEDLKLDSKLDYAIDADGTIKSATPAYAPAQNEPQEDKQKESNVGTNANELN